MAAPERVRSAPHCKYHANSPSEHDICSIQAGKKVRKMHLVLAQIGAIAVAVLVAIGQYQSAQSQAQDQAPDQAQDGQEEQ